MSNRVLISAAWIGTALVAFALGRFAAIDSRWDAYLTWPALAGAVCVLAYIAVHARDRVVIAAVGAVVALNIIAGVYRVRWDLTRNHVYELAPATREVLRTIDAPVRIRLYARETEVPVYRDRLEEYGRASPRVAFRWSLSGTRNR